MERIIIGLGNPGGEYEKTRHNAGRVVLEAVRAAHGCSGWEHKKTRDALVSRGMIAGAPVTLVLPETYMNDSGRSVRKFVRNPEEAEQLVVIHDDIDLPLGKWKFSRDRGDGGHNGLRSINAALKTRSYIRIRVGILPLGEDGSHRKPRGEDKVIKFVLGKFTPGERAKLENVAKEILIALPTLFSNGLEKAMNVAHAKKNPG